MIVGPLVRPPTLLCFSGPSFEGRRYHCILVFGSVLLPYVRYGHPSSYSPCEIVQAPRPYADSPHLRQIPPCQTPRVSKKQCSVSNSTPSAPTNYSATKCVAKHTEPSLFPGHVIPPSLDFPQNASPDTTGTKTGSFQTASICFLAIIPLR